MSKHTPEVQAEIERAYRRGYHQAAFVGSRDAAAGHDLPAWVKACHEWRHAPQYGPRNLAAAGVCPPEAWEVASTGKNDK
jgi:hypothetical protein